MVEFELMDNPKAKLGGDPKEWERIVAVVTLGASWQFKDWPRDYSDPVKLFQKVKGFYPHMVGDKIPVELQGWRVVHGKFNRDKRGLDSVCWANFWKGAAMRGMARRCKARRGLVGRGKAWFQPSP